MKSIIRTSVLDRMDNISFDDREYQQKVLYEKLFNHPFWKESKCVAVTLSKFPELDTGEIINRAQVENKRIVVPKIIDKNMKFIYYTSNTNLEMSRFGVLEPIDNNFIDTEIDLIIVPGVAFNLESRKRIGFGGGFYDKYLSNYTGNTISLIFKEQQTIFDQFEKFDIPVKEILIVN